MYVLNHCIALYMWLKADIFEETVASMESGAKFRLERKNFVGRVWPIVQVLYCIAGPFAVALQNQVSLKGQWQ